MEFLVAAFLIGIASGFAGYLAGTKYQEEIKRCKAAARVQDHLAVARWQKEEYVMKEVLAGRIR